MDNRVVQVEFDVEELHNRVSQLEKILTDLSKWKGFKGFLNQLLSCNLENFTNNDPDIDDNKVDLECISSKGIFHVNDQFSHQENLKKTDANQEAGVKIVAKAVILNTVLKGSRSNPKQNNDDPDWTEAVKTQRKTRSQNGPKCQKCLQRFSSLRGLKTHKATKHRSTNFTRQCLFCRDSPKFANAADLKKHRKLNHPTELGRFSCPRCTKVYSSFENLKQHINVHLGRRPYKCSKCPYKSSWKNALDKHKIRCSGETERVPQPGNFVIKSKKAVLRCPHCPKFLASRQSLQWHINVHLGHRPYKCSKCPYKSSWQTAIVIHKRRCKGKIECEPHSENAVKSPKVWNGLVCPHCSKILKSKQDLQCHINVHTGEKSYTCEFCSNAFRHQPNLTRHLTTCTAKNAKVMLKKQEEIIVLSD